MQKWFQNDRFSDAEVVIRRAAAARHPQHDEAGVFSRILRSSSQGSADSAAAAAHSVMTVALFAGGERDASQDPKRLRVDEGPEELKRFPGLLIVLCQSEYFDAQVTILLAV